MSGNKGEQGYFLGRVDAKGVGDDPVKEFPRDDDSIDSRLSQLIGADMNGNMLRQYPLMNSC